MKKILENGILLCYDIADNGTLQLLYCGREEEFRLPPESFCGCCYPFCMRLTGETTSHIGGARHFGTSGEPWKFDFLEKNEESDGKCYSFHFIRNEQRLTLHYRFYNGICALRSWAELTNDGQEAIGVEYLSSFCLPVLGSAEEANDVRVFLPHNSWRREADWKKYALSDLGMEKINDFATKRIAISNTGSWSTKEYLPMGVWDNIKTKNTILWQIEHNGSWQWEISDENSPFYLLLSGPDEAENHWYRELKTGETFTSVPVAIAFGDDFSSAIGEMTQYRRKIVTKFYADENLPVIFNDYMNCLWANPTTENEIPLIRAVKKLGAEVYCIDAGWYADEGGWWDTIGEWIPSPKRFPNGIGEVFDEIRKCGMIPGIWLEIENMGIRCREVNRFPDDCFVMRHGKKAVDKGRYQLDFRKEQVRKFATDTVTRLVEQYQIGYIKIDYNIDIGCGTEVDSDSFGDGLLQMNRAYLNWIDSIHEKYPALLLENCSSGGMRMDYAMLSHHTLQSVTDQENCRWMAPIASACATAVLPEQSAIWVYPKAENSLAETALNLVNALPLRMHLSGEVLQWSPEQTETVRRGIELYKSIRKNIRKSVPFYPLGVPQYQADWLCAGYRGEECYLAVWRLGGEESVFIPFAEKYNHTEVLFPANGGDVIQGNGGITVTIPDHPGAVLIRLKK